MTTPTAVEANPPALDLRTILINNVVAALLGTGLTVLLHEMVHWFCGAALGYRSLLYSFGVDHQPAPQGTDDVLTSISAPLMSIVIGAVMLAIQRLRQRRGFGQLLWLWVAFTSLQEGVTYFVITPFGAGDTADALASSGWPQWLSIPACFLGVAGMFLTARLFAPFVRSYAGSDLAHQRAFAFHSWLIVVPVLLAVQALMLAVSGMPLTPGETVAIMMASLSVTVFAPMSFIFINKAAAEHQPLELSPVPVAGLAGYALLVVFNLLIRHGLALG